MNLIVNEVMQLQVVHDTHGYGVIELFAGTSVINHGFKGFVKSCFSECLFYVIVLCTVKYGGCNLYKSARSCRILCRKNLLFEVIVYYCIFKLFACFKA